MLAPLTLFAVLAFVSLPAAAALLVCVPLIPAAIAAVQTWAKKLLSKYWGQYTSLGDTFLENLQGLTTLKIYDADEERQQKMNQEAEQFRKITMKVLTMQLNSITIMDLVAYGGAALGMILAVTQFSAGNIGLGSCLVIILLSADYFIPMRQLGSFFHIAMNGMAASDKIFRLLDLEEPKPAREATAAPLWRPKPSAPTALCTATGLRCGKRFAGAHDFPSKIQKKWARCFAQSGSAPTFCSGRKKNRTSGKEGGQRPAISRKRRELCHSFAILSLVIWWEI